MYERVGGGPALQEAVDRFYRRLLDDPELAGYFPGDLTALKQHQAALLAQVLGGPSRYAGRDLAEAHATLGITATHFQKVVFYLVGTLWELGAPMDITMAVGLTVSSLQDQIVTASAPGVGAA
ncbi:MAG TPA: group 1 truncated hemoglobin [Rugosimonospora sp.]|nr:group 1 truncated hemoglobin [Rugosimonospora sp.]